MSAEQAATIRRALEDERRFLLRSLADLDAERAAGDLDEADYVELRDHYTAKAAAVLRRLESDPETELDADRRDTTDVRDEPSEPAAEDRPADAPGSRPTTGTRRLWRSLGIVAGVLAFGALVGWGVARATAPSLPGQTITGSQANEETDELIEAQKLQAKGNPVGALKLYNKVLAADPGQPEALTYKGWILAQAGYTSQALSDFAQAEAADPSYSDVHVYRGIVLLDAKNDASGAIAEFRYYLHHHPDPQLSSLVKTALARAEQDLAKAKGH